MRLGPYWTAYLLNWLALWVAGIVGGSLVARASGLTRAALWGGIFLVAEWHLVWAAGSGMETLAYAVLILLIFRALLQNSGSQQHWLGLGLLIGISVWLRPDGITLLGPAALTIGVSPTSWRRKFGDSALLLLGFLIPFGLYLAFNRILAGSWWPNTFYAKQTEYAELRAAPFWIRYLRQLGLPLVGAGAVLLPGFVYFLWQAILRRKYCWLAMGLWFLGTLGMYAWRLPVLYQHGRYLIPAMPVYFILGFAGMLQWLQPGSPAFWRRILSKAWPLLVASIAVAFWGLGAYTYAQDVAIIESEMVETSRWVAENTPPDALIAAHDIGALGYFGQRKILDLAGLITPGVIPFLRDEAALADHLTARQADFLVTFPGWYPHLINALPLVFQTQGAFSPRQGGENMAVFEWVLSNQD